MEPPLERPGDTADECQVMAGLRPFHPQFALMRPAIERGRMRPWLLKLDDDLVRPFMAGLRQCHRQLAHRKPAIERGRTRPWLFRLDGDLDRRLVADCTHPQKPHESGRRIQRRFYRTSIELVLSAISSRSRARSHGHSDVVQADNGLSPANRRGFLTGAGHEFAKPTSYSRIADSPHPVEPD